MFKQLLNLIKFKLLKENVYNFSLKNYFIN